IGAAAALGEGGARGNGQGFARGYIIGESVDCSTTLEGGAEIDLDVTSVAERVGADLEGAAAAAVADTELDIAVGQVVERAAGEVEDLAAVERIGRKENRAAVIERAGDIQLGRSVVVGLDIEVAAAGDTEGAGEGDEVVDVEVIDPARGAD